MALIIISGVFFFLGWMLGGVSTGDISIFKLYGLAIGIIITLVPLMILTLRDYIGYTVPIGEKAEKILKFVNILTKIGTILSVISLVLSILGLSLPENAFYINSIQLIIGFSVLVIAILLLIFVDTYLSIAFIFMLVLTVILWIINGLIDKFRQSGG